MIIWVERTEDSRFVGYCINLTIEGPTKHMTQPQPTWHEARSIISTMAALQERQAAIDLRAWARKNGWPSTEEVREMLGW